MGFEVFIKARPPALGSSSSCTALSETAFGVLLNFSIRERRYNAALDLVKELDPQHQAAFTARVANAMWEAQLRAAAEGAPEDERLPLRQQAAQLLKNSFEPLKKDTSATSVLAASSLYLTQSLLDEGDYARAVSDRAWLLQRRVIKLARSFRR